MDNIEHRQRISQHVSNRTEDIEKDGVRLNRRSYFPHPDLRAFPAQRTIIEGLLRRLDPGPKFFREARKKTFEILCANLLYTKHPLKMAMDEQFWSKDSHGDITPSIIKDVRLLHEAGLIYMKKGSEVSKRYTRIYPRRSFFMEFPLPLRLNHGVDFVPRNFVVLRKTIEKGYRKFINPLTGKEERQRYVKKVEIPFKPTRETERVSSILRTHFNVTHSYEIDLRYPGHPLTYLTTAMRASYTNDLHHGGRLYSYTDWGIQQLESEWRKHIFIHGEATTELDFSGLSINMLYGRENSFYEGDPYTVVLEGIPKLRDNEKPVIRDFLKKLLQSILNSKSKPDAVGSGNYTIYKEVKQGKTQVRDILRRLDVSVAELVARFQDEHKTIQRHFYSEVGLELQNQDAKIALRIINHFNKKRIPVLAIHDSFIVAERYTNELRTAMEESYMTVMKTDRPCPIKS